MRNQIVLGAALALAACGGGQSTGGTTAEGGEYAGPIASTDVAAGETAYNSKCGGCHASGGTAPAIADIGWTPAHMRQQIREGSGGMPAIGPSRLSDEDMESMLAYLVTINAVAE